MLATAMKPRRSKEHTTLTETATLVIDELAKIPGIKAISPGIIKSSSRRGASKRFVTAVFTNAGMELIISGQSVQKVAVHTSGDAELIFKTLATSKRLAGFAFKTRNRFPGI